jgi:hypothetical protein
MPAFRIFDPHAFLRYEDQTANPAKVAKAAKVTREEPGTLATLAPLAAPAVKTEHDRAAIDEPVLMPDGRSLWRFGANDMPLSATPQAMELIDEARRCGAVLVADGPELIVVERWRSRLPSETRDALRHRAAEVIGAMRRARKSEELD